MITAYFGLQYRMLNRQWKDTGLHPFVGYLLCLTLFVGLSACLFYSISHAAYFYVLVSLHCVFLLSGRDRNDFLKICLSGKDCRKIRIMENLLVAFPFVAFLLYRQCFWLAAALWAVSAPVSLIHVRSRSSFVLPTPFSKRPFEFTVGFRKTYGLYAIACGLTGIAVAVDNFNLGMFALLFIFAIAWSFYLKPENSYYVWQYGMSPSQFLRCKMRTAGFYSLLSAMPVMLALGVFYPEKIWITELCLLLGEAFLMLMILAKYTAWPKEPGIKEVLLISICLGFPPMLLVVLPLFLIQSLKQLGTLLK